MIRVATKNDIKSISEIEKSCFSCPWTEKMLEQSFDSGCSFVLCEQDGMPVGYAGIYPSGDITNIAVTFNYRGKGYGTQLVRAIIGIAKEIGTDGVFLEVRPSNKVAIKVYEKCGFKQISCRKRYYEDGEDALIYAFGGV